jgi:hypothetical protein
MAVAAVVVAAGAAAIVGATGRWVSVRLLGDTASVDGLNSHLDGSMALAIAVTGIIAGLALAVTTRSSRTSLVALVLAAALGIAGLAVTLYEYQHLHHLGVVEGLVPLIDYPVEYFGLHSTVGWGLRLCGVGFGSMALAAVGGLALRSAQSTRSAPPSTGITQPLRYDAAGDSTNAAT